MSGYSLDLRERIIGAWQDGEVQARIAETFSVSVNTVGRYIRRFRQTGSVVATIQGREEPLIGNAQASVVQAMVDEQPELTLEGYCEAWAKRTGQRVSDSTMSRALHRFDRPRKKNGGSRRAR